MGSKSFKVEVNREVLSWARESSGYSIQEVAALTKIAERTLTQWETGNRVPTLDALSKLARLYKRSVAVLLLPAPPVGASLPADFRQLSDSNADLSPRTRLVIRTARWLAQRAGELESELGLSRPTTDQRARVTDDPEALADEFRACLGVTIQEQVAFRSIGQAFREWREALEKYGYFVFQFPMPTEEALGFSVADDGKRAIVVNRSDGLLARRIFTLFHECGHLLLAKPGVCLPDEGQVGKSEAVETFCNRFANAVLIPRSEASQLQQAIRNSDVARTARDFASRYHVSKPVVLSSMRRFELITQQQYSELAMKWKSLGEKRKQARGGKGESAVDKCIRQRGRRLAKSVLDGADRNLITTTDAMKYLNVNLADLSTLRTRVRATLA